MGQSSIGQYDTIRFLLENIYTFGMYSREEFSKISIGKNNYDKLLQLFRQIFPENVLDARMDGNRKILRFRHDSFQNDSDHLVASFAAHTIKDSLLVHMAVLLSKFSIKSEVSEKEIGLEIEMLPGNDAADKRSTLYRQRRAMMNFGYLTSCEKGRGKVKLHTFSGYDNETLKRLYIFADFCAGASPLRVAPILLRNTIRRALKIRGIRPPETAFLFRNNICRNIFDEALVYTLLYACKHQKNVELDTDSRKFRVSPAFLRFDTRSGRWYLFALSTVTPTIIRLSRIKHARVLSQTLFDPHAVQGAVNDCFACCNISSGQGEHGPVLVEAELHFQREPGQRRQFEREMLLGQIIQRDGVEIYQAQVNDPTELIPFLRSYGGFIRILPGQHHLDLQCTQSWQAMLHELEGEYGTVQ